ncbi:amidohydrolase/deacetylase family metallohydrolase [Bacillus sp. FSL K6-3431]|uniref:amidohydrolase/deacetylase family metallohydrolase n=1 Tax=Bacillus sp. FSL K6-3431 TaxID=2921500 RepID=UPI0030F7571B
MVSCVLRNVRRISEEEVDIVIESGKVNAIVSAGSGRGKIIDCSGMYVSSGWIDMHVHAFPEFDPYGDEIDVIGIKQGVTTIVDAGSCGADRISDLAASGATSKTNVFSFLNISKIGLSRVDELSNLEWIDKDQVLQAVNEHKDFIIGLKARMSKSVVGNCGTEPLCIARKLSDETALPIMVHIGSGPPHIDDIVSLLQKGDIITHYLHGKPNNLFDNDGKALQVLTDAVNRDVQLDVGHGTASFSFKVAALAKANHIKLGTISTDIYRGNRLSGPVYSMANVLSKFLYLGYSLQEVIDAVTIKPAIWLDKPELGRIEIGERANLTLFTIHSGPVEFIDSEGDKRLGNRIIETKGVVMNGEFIKC